MKQKYAGQQQYDLGQKQGPYHQDQPIGGPLADAMQAKYAQLPLFNKQMPTAGVGNGYSEPNQAINYGGAANNFYA